MLGKKIKEVHLRAVAFLFLSRQMFDSKPALTLRMVSFTIFIQASSGIGRVRCRWSPTATRCSHADGPKASLASLMIVLNIATAEKRKRTVIEIGCTYVNAEMMDEVVPMELDPLLTKLLVLWTHL